MKKKEKVNFIINTLENLCPEITIPPQHEDPYTLLIAVLLSARTIDARVNQITPAPFAKADNPYSVVLLSVDEIREIIKSLGLAPMESRGIHGPSQILIDRCNGEVSRTFETLEALPPVGHKTASVALSQALDIPTFPANAHVRRLMRRRGLSGGSSVVQTEKDAKRLFPKEKWNELHIQTILYGREYSPVCGWDMEKDIVAKMIIQSKK